MRKGRGGGAVASIAERRELLQSETLQMYIPMCAYPCVHTCNIGVDSVEEFFPKKKLQVFVKRNRERRDDLQTKRVGALGLAQEPHWVPSTKWD